MKKRLLSLLLVCCAAVLLFAALPVTAQAETEGDWEYSVSSGLATITKYNGTDAVVTIPESFGLYQVASIGKNAFEGNLNMTQVNFPKGLTSIGAYAFKGCAALKELSLPAKLTTLGDYAFQNCIGLEKITFNCTNLSDIRTDYRFVAQPFYGAGTSTDGIEVIFAEGCTHVPANLFYAYSGTASAPNVTSVTLADSITEIRGSAFRGCTYLQTVDLANVVTVGSFSFANCSALTNIIWSDKLTTIGESAFFECSALTELSLPKGVNSVGNSAFGNCPAITTLNLPTSLVTIGNSAFANDVGLTELVLPERLATLGDYAFENCTKLEKITFNCTSLNDIRTDYRFVAQPFKNAGTAGDGIEVVFAEGCTRVAPSLFHAYSGPASAPNVTKVTIANSTTLIGYNSFRGCVYLTSVEMGGTQDVGEGAFMDCTALTDITWTDDQTTIHPSAFQNCTKLKTVTFPNSLTTIKDYAFSGCAALESVTFPKGLTSIGKQAFDSCTSLTELTLPEKLATLGDYAFQKCTKLEKIIFNCTSLNDIRTDYRFVAQPFYGAGTAGDGIEVIFAEGCTRVAPSLFYAYSGADSAANVTKVTVANSTTLIGYNAFRGCRYLTSVEMGGAVDVGEGAFQDCTALTDITWTDSQTTIHPSAFKSCTKLKNVTLPKSVISIMESAFSDCTTMESIEFPSGLTSIGKHAFYGCTSLTELTLPEKLATLGDYAFEKCSALEKITFNCTSLNDIRTDYRFVAQPFYEAGTAGNGIEAVFAAGVTRIPANLFYAYSGAAASPILTKVTVGKDVVEIGNNAFTNCDELKEITFTGAVPKIADNIFGSVVATGYHPGWPEEALQNYGGTITWIGEKPACTHAETTVQNAKAATCTAEGYTGDTVCASCGETLEAGEPIPMTNHTEEILPAVAPTCKDTGLTEGKKCSVCGETLVKQETVPVTDHTWDAGKITTEATPEKPGIKTFTCTVCQITRTEEVPFSCEHNADTETKLVNQKDADCTADGYTGDTVCVNCGEVLTKGEIIPAKGHTEEVIPAVAPTCKDTGLTVGKKCSVCGETLVKQETVPVTDHTWDTGKITTEATPDAPGVKTFTCTVCGETKTEPVVFNCTHTTNPETKVVNQKDATCAEEGYTGDTVCANCGEVLSKGEVIPKTDHTWDEGKVTTEATPEKPGVKTFTCTVCQATKTEEIRYVNPDIPPVPELPEEPVEDTSIFRIAGDNRFETAFMVANQMKENLGVEKFNAIIVASGTNFADALSGSYLAAVKQAPILLSYNEEFNDRAKNYIRENLADGGIARGRRSRQRCRCSPHPPAQQLHRSRPQTRGC